jgi:hypothetical protein
MSVAAYRHATIDCPAPVALARFYAELLGLQVEPLGEMKEEDVEWIRIQNEVGAPIMGFAKVENYIVPTWPEGPVPQQLHMEFSVADLDVAEAQAISIGATKHAFQPGDTFRVYLDPVGHPFCLIENYND